MRYKEVTGHLPFMKAKVEKDTIHISSENQSQGSGIFEVNEKKGMDAVSTIPARTISE